MFSDKQKSNPELAIWFPKKKSKILSYPIIKSSTRSLEKTENRAFKLQNLANPLAGIVIDDFLFYIDDKIKSSSETFEGQ